MLGEATVLYMRHIWPVSTSQVLSQSNVTWVMFVFAFCLLILGYLTIHDRLYRVRK